MNRITTVVLALLAVTATLPVAAVGAGANAASPSQQSGGSADASAYAGTHVQFDTASNAIVDYRVDGQQVFENVTVASQRDHHSRSGLGANIGLDAVVNLSGLGLELETRTETRAEIATEGSASMSAHDSERGILTVHAGDQAQYVEVDLAANGSAEAESDDRVVVDSGNRTGTFVVVGDGEVTVNEHGDVTADLQQNATLVFRSYADGERDESAKTQERLIANGTATAEVYAEQRDGETVADVATYGEDVTVETANETEDRLEMTVERARSEGTVVIASVSDAAVAGAESADDLAVTVDGEAAAQASSYSELKGGIGEEPRYMVTQSSDASASADVLIAVDHFSERDVAIQSADGGSSDDGSGDSVPGFGVGAALVALLVGTGARIRQ